MLINVLLSSIFECNYEFINIIIVSKLESESASWMESMTLSCDWLIGMLLVSKSGLVEENTVQMKGL